MENSLHVFLHPKTRKYYRQYSHTYQLKKVTCNLENAITRSSPS